MPEPFDSKLALGAPPALREFNVAGVLEAADVHVAVALAQLAAVDDPDVLLAAALAVRAPRLGHVFVDLQTVSQTATADGDEIATQSLPWPDASAWAARVEAVSALVGPSDGSGVYPLRLVGSRLYLDRYFREERRLASSLLALSRLRPDIGELPMLARELHELFPGDDDTLQRAALATSVMRNLTVIAGGPGTGKTTTIAALVQLLRGRARATDRPEPLIALCAPTGKAAARMQQAVGDGACASTIHKLLGWLPGGRFRYNAGSRLPHDIVIVDETSMVPLTLMGQLVEAVRADAQLVLVGDPDQLAAIEAGAVLRDIVGPAAAGLRLSSGTRSMLELSAGPDLPPATAERSFGDGVIVLRVGHRFGAAIGDLADAVGRGDGDAAVAALRSSGDQIIWPQDATDALRATAVSAYSAVVDAARAGDAAAAVDALAGFRILCAHRHGPAGVSHWTRQVENWLTEALPGFHPDGGVYVGRPLMITENDYELQLFNGDTGVIVAGDQQQPVAMFDAARPGFAPSRLGGAETVYATTVHKSQGSQFATAAVILPDPESQLLTRELLYTAVTRARDKLIVSGSEEAVRAAVNRPLRRATGLRDLLWSQQPVS